MIRQSASLMRVVYVSRNAIAKPVEEMKWEIDAILERAQRNNALAGVTGALIFNGGIFAQVLEGPMDGVEEIFDRRCFAGWSMGYCGGDAAAAAVFGGLGGDPRLDGLTPEVGAMLEALRGIALRDELRLRAA
jgi:hypothetical protein